MGLHQAGDKVTILISGVPQGSILGPVLFNVLVDNLEAGFKPILSKLADHTKLGGPVDSLKVREALHRDLDRLECKHNNCVKVDKSKCQILQLGQHIPGYGYRLGNERLKSRPVERDLRVLVNSKMNMSQQCALANNRANYSLECINHGIAS